MYGKVYRVYTTSIFKGVKGVAMATKIGQRLNQNCTDFSSVQDIETMLACIVGFWGSVNSNMLTKI